MVDGEYRAQEEFGYCRAYENSNNETETCSDGDEATRRPRQGRESRGDASFGREVRRVGSGSVVDSTHLLTQLVQPQVRGSRSSLMF